VSAQQRLLACQPLSSPFVLVQQLAHPAHPKAP
jgi:hypothetical protein